ncbi:preprotein translocase subunit SecE [Collinsella tanakaei]|uniref:preprotein translocase subunit SecE n=1 Tax=Collinsella tanakaei TaxID=626935 RepID=UPI0025A4C27A|nr:preprotein translocase subunit SecE [Collinsella tanakaei]MDM8300200.1 preprotein translocase subunit SecE [Collinsella tanakaei]
MANKKSKKSTQASPASEAAEARKVAPKKAQAKKAVAAKKDANVKKATSAKKTTKDKKNAKPGFLARTKKYFAQVRSEMKRVVWPSKKELVNYSVAVVVSLIAVGVVIAVLDSVISGGLVLFSGLRG